MRQGDGISPKLFTNALEDVFKTLSWEGRSININGKYISHLRFADTIVILAKSLQDLQLMLDGLVDSSVPSGLRMYLDKTKIMFNEHVTPEPIAVNGGALEVIRPCSCKAARSVSLPLEVVFTKLQSLVKTTSRGRLTEEFSSAGRHFVKCVESPRHQFHRVKRLNSLRVRTTCYD